MFPDFAFCLECYILFFLYCFLHFLSQAYLILSVNIQNWAHFYGCNNRQGLLGCLCFEICDLFMKTKSHHTSLEEHNFSISPILTRYTKLSFIFWFPANVTRIETCIKITSIITRKILQLFSRINCNLFCKT